ncbi:MAG TPA: ATP-binding protein, partial [Pseudonocardiaceae bacterium]|nr:ATP-binding protein [Pseudonocardiaceae bacterium]
MRQPSTISLVGRHGELGAISQEISLTAQRRSSSLVVITGVSGVGKTALLGTVGSVARSQGHEFIELSVDDLPNAAEVPASLTLQEKTPGSNSHFTGSNGQRATGILLREHVAARKRTPSIVMTIDDLDRAETNGLAAIRALVGQFANRPVTWIFSWNLDRESSALATVLRYFGIESKLDLELGPLSQGEAYELAHAVLGDSLEPALVEIIDAADGNPGIIVSITREYFRSGRLDGSTDLALTNYFRDSLSKRISSVSPEAPRVLEAAAVLGGSFEVDDLANMLEMSV